MYYKSALFRLTKQTSKNVADTTFKEARQGTKAKN